MHSYENSRRLQPGFARPDSGFTASADQRKKEVPEPAFFWLSVFYLLYCARPQEIIPGLGWLPVAKFTGALALLSLGLSIGRAPRKLSDLPREAYYLFALIAVLFASSILSPVWRGGAFAMTLDFSKVLVLWVLAFLLITDLARLRRIITIQAGSVALISLIALVKGHSVDRLNAVIGGIYSNPNDLAFAIVLSIPLALALVLTAKSSAATLGWAVCILFMGIALLRTASRAGFIDLLIAGAVCLWQFGVKGRRFYLIPATVVIGVALLAVAGGTLRERFGASSSDSISEHEAEATASYQERKLLMEEAVDAIARYPILGLGPGNFVVYSGMWLEVHAEYLQIAVEGGILALILYLLFFWRGFVNLWRISKAHLSDEADVYRGALLASLIGFVVGAAFSPEAYHFFPYLTVGYSSVLLAIVHEQGATAAEPQVREWRRFGSATAARTPRRRTAP